MEKRQRALGVFIAIGFIAITGCALDGTHGHEEDGLIPPDTMHTISPEDIAWTEKVYTYSGMYTENANERYSKFYFNKDNKLILKRYYVAPAGTEDWKRHSIEEIIYDSAGRVRYYDVFKGGESYYAGEWDAKYVYNYNEDNTISKITKYRDGDRITVRQYADFSYSKMESNIVLHDLENGERVSTFNISKIVKEGGEYDTKITINALIQLYGTTSLSVEYFYLGGALVKEVRTDLSTGGIVRYLYKKDSNGKYYKYLDLNYNSVIDGKDVKLRRYVNLHQSNYDPFDPMNAFNVLNIISYLWGIEQRDCNYLL